VTSNSSLDEIAEAKLSLSDTDYRSIIKKKSKREQAQIKEISVKRSDSLEKKRQARLSEAERQRQEAINEKREARLKWATKGAADGDDSDDDIPDLM